MQGDTDEEVMAAAIEHASTVHGIRAEQVTDEIVEAVRAHIKDV